MNLLRDARRALRGEGPKVDKLLSDIIRDFHNQIWTPKSHMSLANAAPFVVPENEPLVIARLTQFLVPTNQNSHRVHRFIFLGILSLSSNFMKELLLKNDRSSLWEPLMELLDTHEEIITFYARVRLAPWHNALIAYFDKIRDTTTDSPPFRTQTMPAGAPLPPLGLNDNFFRNQPNTHPEIFCLTAQGTAALNTVVSGSNAGIPMQDIPESSYTRAHWPARAPAYWPAHRRYPDHPQNVRDCHDGGAADANDFLECAKCDRTFRMIDGGVIGCNCTKVTVTTGCSCNMAKGCKCPNWCAESSVQVKQLPAYPAAPGAAPQLNKGVIAMQQIHVREVLGEYTGELLPTGTTDASIPGNAHADDIYTMEFHAHGFRKKTKQRKEGVELGPIIGEVSAAWKGSWARFINTAPVKSQWNVEFDELLVEDRVRIVVRAIKEIKIGDEILASYGVPYMKDLFGAAWKE